jgi:hypothetical protein
LVNRNIGSVPRIVGDIAKALPGQMTRPVPVILEAVMKLDKWLHPVSFPLKQFTFQHSFWVVKLGVLFCCCLLICFSLAFLSPAKGAGIFYKEFSASSRDYLGAEGGIEPVPLLFDVPHSPPPLITARAPPDSELKGSIEVLEENVPSKAAPDDWEWLHQVYNNGKIPFEVKEHAQAKLAAVRCYFRTTFLATLSTAFLSHFGTSPPASFLSFILALWTLLPMNFHLLA